ncbi:MAG: hypothetical protein ACRDZ3_16475 [Acidimicrobiia bacterium]
MAFGQTPGPPASAKQMSLPRVEKSLEQMHRGDYEFVSSADL